MNRIPRAVYTKELRDEAVKYGVIEHMRRDYPVPSMCRVLGVSVSGYYAWRNRKPSERTQQEPRLEAEVLAAHQRTRESFGPERLQQHLEERGVRIGVHRIRRLRRSEYIEIFYNRQRTQARLNYQSPVAFTQRFYLNQIAA
ncbi:hypothetical protein LGM65_31880 [Burkholderia anthina]|nr:hypothetical protein [Burkholderia anthina]MCA8095417.1 hypothetical protein [Burkholderia anthina]